MSDKLDIKAIRALASKARQVEETLETPHNMRVERVRERIRRGHAPRHLKGKKTLAGEHKGYFKTGSSVRRCPHWIEKPKEGRPRRCNQVCVRGHDKCRHHMARPIWNKIRSQRKDADPVRRQWSVLGRALSKGEIILPDSMWQEPLWLACSEVLRIVPVDRPDGHPSKMTNLEWAKLRYLRHDSEFMPREEIMRRRRFFRRYIYEMLDAWTQYEMGSPSAWVEMNRMARERDLHKPVTDRRPKQR
jgi:hypothetical protein